MRGLHGLPPEILLIPLAGHTWGHTGVAIAQAGGWLLYAGDAYFYRGEVGAEAYACPPGMRADAPRTARRTTPAPTRP